jgi:ActR/RegA family two-component response regulator
MNNLLCKVLVVDDIEDVRNTVAGVLRDCGYYVKTASNESEAKIVLATEVFHFVVLDIRLRGHAADDDSGLKLAKSIREQGIRSKIIFVTGSSIETSHIESVIEYGVIAYIMKIGDWIETVHQTIERNFLRFDVFLCHNTQDKPRIKQIGNDLISRGLRPWLDEWELRPGLPWQDALEQQIGEINAAAVFVGKNGIGPWQEAELRAFLGEFVSRKCPVIPVLLSNAPKKPVLPVFLRGMMWVDFRRTDPDPMRQLIWGITGKKY